MNDLTFDEGFTIGLAKACNAAAAGDKFKTLDWNKAVELILEQYNCNKKIRVKAGLRNDFVETGETIFKDGKSFNRKVCTNLWGRSNWATPILRFYVNGKMVKEVECFQAFSGEYIKNNIDKWPHKFWLESARKQLDEEVEKINKNS